MSDDFLYALKRSATILGALAGGLFVVGLAWALLDHHRIGFSVAVFFYAGAGCVAAYSAFSQSASRNTWDAMTAEQQDEQFETQMWLYAIAAALGVLGFAIQSLL
jgi:hypothetical protein